MKLTIQQQVSKFDDAVRSQLLALMLDDDDLISVEVEARIQPAEPEVGILADYLIALHWRLEAPVLDDEARAAVEAALICWVGHETAMSDPPQTGDDE